MNETAPATISDVIDLDRRTRSRAGALIAGQVG
jgi:hypothetical protein